MSAIPHARAFGIAAIAATVLAVVVAPAPRAGGQETSVRPGINDAYRDPDLDRWIDRLESEDRAIFEYRHAIVAALALKAGMEVADVGAGTGFLTRMIARAVGPEGRVYAVDVVPEFLEHIASGAKEDGLTNVTTVLGGQKSTGLEADAVDLVLVCDTYHHFEFPRHTLASLHSALRDGGRLVVIDFERIEGVSGDFAIEHVRAGRGTFTDEIKNAGFELLREIPLMEHEGQYYLEFGKR
ncbi:MAG TPA: methyltransferase domain-containing protein [Thermoanaerobaculia bacterium]|nr:methyltransferase domain-containing protein [Thermoanaerobaculia bacterium]